MTGISGAAKGCYVSGSRVYKAEDTRLHRFVALKFLYLQRFLQTVRNNWHQRSPEFANTKKRNVAIEFVITQDGKFTDIRKVASSGDLSLIARLGAPS